MKKKINLQFLFLSFAAIVVTMVITTAVYYELFKTEVLDDLRASIHVLIGTGSFDNAEHVEFATKYEDLRITMIAPDGTVLYDNEADILDMDNHGSRPEVERAFQSGWGQAIRKSDTLNQNTFYYASRLENGCVLRVAKEAGSIFSIVESIFPMMLVLIICLFASIVTLTHYLTKSIVSPIEQMANNMDHLENVDAYKEMQPFINTIQKQHEDIVKSAQIRQEFTANVSHELKTPLTSISGYSELIENGMATQGDVEHFAGEIHRNAERLLTLINDIIRLSELDVMEDVPEMESLDLHAIAQTAVDMLQINAENHDIILRLDGQTSMIRGNKMMMEELVYNLTDNAIRYNNKGGKVFVSVYSHAGHTVLSVKDTGIGISMEHQDRVFERFYRVDKSRSKSTGGTGLGLAIVKHIVAQHNAKLDLNSEPGKGTEIKVEFS
ncbi:MAG: ATP-binding protein [Lachnospiraceae bacterium]|nr:ATP-binding protein [Lachnospiraceae bacterium]